MGEGRIGAWGPGSRICVVGNKESGSLVVYAMDLAPFRVKRKKGCCWSCYDVKLYGGGMREKAESLVVGESLLGYDHCHSYSKRRHSRSRRPIFESDCRGCTFVPVDSSTAYCFCDYLDDHDCLISLLDDGSGKLAVVTQEFACSDYSSRDSRMLAVDGKLYSLGGFLPPDHDDNKSKSKIKIKSNESSSEDDDDDEYIWSEVFDPATARWDTFTYSAPFDRVICEATAYREFYAANWQSRIVIISPPQSAVYAHDPHAPTGWECLLYDSEISFMRSQPSIAGSTMYWLNRQVCALDLETGDFFQGFIPSNEISDMINGTWDNDSVQEYRLIHIGGDAEDVFCLVWSGCGECHFTRLRISKDYDSLEEEEEQEGRRVGDIHISIISCSSMFTPEIYSLTDVMLMDRVDGTNSTKEAKLESVCEEVPNKDSSGSVSVLKRCKKRSVDSVKALSEKEGASLCEVVISKKVELEMPNKDASGSASVLKRCKKRSVDSVKALSQKEGASLCEVVISKKLNLESACEEMPNKDASGSASVLKRCNKRSVDSVKALSRKEGASLCEVVISKKVKLESACEEMPNKDASGSPSVLKRCKKRSVVTEKSSSQEEDASDSELVKSKKISLCSEKLLPSKEDASDSEVIGSPGVLKRCKNSRVDTKKSFPSK